MPYDVAAVRAHFPALREGAAHYDGPGGSKTPDVVAEAVARTLTSAVANRGAVTPAERRADRIVHDARSAMGDLLGVVPEGVVFGRSATELTFMVARTLAQGWGPGDEVVVTRLDRLTRSTSDLLRIRSASPRKALDYSHFDEPRADTTSPLFRFQSKFVIAAS